MKNIDGVPQPANGGATSHGLEAIRSLVLNAVHSVHSRRAYRKALDDFFEWYSAVSPGPLSKAVIQQYRTLLQQQNLSPATINVRLAALRKLAAEAADNGLVPPQLAAGIKGVKGVPQHGLRAGNWLSREQSVALLRAPDPRTMKGRRDRAILAALIGCGLRRSELLSLETTHLQLRDGRWVLADLKGKGNRIRTVPVPDWVKAAFDSWLQAASISSGRIFRALKKTGQLAADSLTEKVVWWVVRDHADRAGLPPISPHDLRRTCAKLCRASGGDLEQIQFLLGHASIQTTERYLGTRQDLVHAVNDHIVLEG